eukprot:scaffold3941_cov223-Amphora_coffeaeformis.AAC.3
MSPVVLLLILELFCLFRPSTADAEVELIDRLFRKYKDWRPAAMVDVGANAGLWTTRVLNELYDDDDDDDKHQEMYPLVLMIEATEMHRQALQDVTNRFGANKIFFRINVLADADDRVVNFYQGKNTGNSIFRENTKHYQNDIPVKRKAVTLDTAVQQSFFGTTHRVDYLKLDVQGSELLVLQGATQLLQTVTFIQFEVSAVEYNSGGAACWSDLDHFLQRHGFRLYDFGDKVYNADAFHTQGVGQLDVLYYRPDSPHRPAGLDDAKFCTPLFLLAETTTTSTTTTTTTTTALGVHDMPFGIESLLREEYFSWTQMGTLVLGLVAGYLLGSKKNKRKQSTGGRMQRR